MTRPDLRDTVGIRVWAEGLAVATSRIIHAGLGDLAYYSVDDASWVQRCRVQRQVLARTIADNLTRTDPRLVYALCGVKTDEPWPSRAGYWIGDMIVQEELSRGATIQELLAWDPGADQRGVADQHCASALLRAHLKGVCYRCAGQLRSAARSVAPPGS
jgi:glycerol-3-phosphate dehydrogenase